MADLSKILKGEFDFPVSSVHARVIAAQMNASPGAALPARGIAGTSQDPAKLRFSASGSAALRRFNDAVNEQRAKNGGFGNRLVSHQPLDMGGLVSTSLNRDLDTSNEVLTYNRMKPNDALRKFVKEAVDRHIADVETNNRHLAPHVRMAMAKDTVDKLNAFHYGTIVQHAAKMGKKLVVDTSREGSIAAAVSPDVISPVGLRKWKGPDLHRDDLAPNRYLPNGKYLDNIDKGREFFSN